MDLPLGHAKIVGFYDEKGSLNPCCDGLTARTDHDPDSTHEVVVVS